MKKTKTQIASILLVVLSTIFIIGCGSDGTYEEAPGAALTQTVLTGDDAGDISATQVVSGGDVQIGDNTSQTLSVATESGAVTLDMTHFFDPEAIPKSDISQDKETLDAAEDAATCSALGGFWCSIEQACLGLDGATATCPAS